LYATQVVLNTAVIGKPEQQAKHHTVTAINNRDQPIRSLLLLVDATYIWVLMSTSY